MAFSSRLKLYKTKCVSISQPALSSFHVFVFVFVLCLNLYLYLSTSLMSFSLAPFRACLVVTFLGWVVILCENGSFFCLKICCFSVYFFFVLLHTAPSYLILGILNPGILWYFVNPNFMLLVRIIDTLEI